MSFSPIDKTTYPLTSPRLGPAWRYALDMTASGDWVEAYGLTVEMADLAGIKRESARNLIYSARRCEFFESERRPDPRFPRYGQLYIRLNEHWRP